MPWTLLVRPLRKQSVHQFTMYFKTVFPCTAPQMIPDRKWSPDQKWSPNWTSNMILNRKWSLKWTANDPAGNREWHGVWFPQVFYFTFIFIYLFIYFYQLNNELDTELKKRYSDDVKYNQIVLKNYWKMLVDSNTISQQTRSTILA